MKSKLTEWLVRPLINEVELPIKVGDTVLMGRFKINADLPANP